MTRNVPSGTHKGRALDSFDKQELQSLWAGWNGSPSLRKTEFFVAIELEIQLRTGGDNFASRHQASGRDIGLLPFPEDDATSVVEPVIDRMEFGKHKGEPVSLVPMHYLLWCEENITSGMMVTVVAAEIVRRTGCLVVPSSTVAAKPTVKKAGRSLDDATTHYRWEDLSGFTHSIAVLPLTISCGSNTAA